MSSGLKARQSFEQRAKRQGIQVKQTSLSSSALDPEAYFRRFRGLDFWITDKQKHEDTFDRVAAKLYSEKGSDKTACCFWHAGITTAEFNINDCFLLKTDGIVTGILYGITRSKRSTLLNLVEFIPVIGDFVPAYTISTLLWIYSESKQKQAIIQ